MEYWQTVISFLCSDRDVSIVLGEWALLWSLVHGKGQDSYESDPSHTLNHDFQDLDARGSNFSLQIRAQCQHEGGEFLLRSGTVFFNSALSPHLPEAPDEVI
jgi:hypothetical protein